MTAYTDVIINPGRMIVNTFIHLLSEKIKDSKKMLAVFFTELLNLYSRKGFKHYPDFKDDKSYRHKSKEYKCNALHIESEIGRNRILTVKIT